MQAQEGSRCWVEGQGVRRVPGTGSRNVFPGAGGWVVPPCSPFLREEVTGFQRGPAPTRAQGGPQRPWRQEPVEALGPGSGRSPTHPPPMATASGVSPLPGPGPVSEAAVNFKNCPPDPQFASRKPITPWSLLVSHMAAGPHVRVACGRGGTGWGRGATLRGLDRCWEAVLPDSGAGDRDQPRPSPARGRGGAPQRVLAVWIACLSGAGAERFTEAMGCTRVALGPAGEVGEGAPRS